MTKSKKITICVCVGFLLIAVLGTIFDLQISKAFASLTPGYYYSQNFFAMLGECFGEDVLYVLLISAFAILFFNFFKFKICNKKWLNYGLMTFACLVSYAIAFYSFRKTLEYLSIYTDIGIKDYMSSAIGIITQIVMSFVICVVIFYLISKLNNDQLKSLFKWAIIVLVACLVSNAVVQISKRIFDRARYRAMISEGYTDFEYFTNWFIINTKKFESISSNASDYFKSFPSGHTCAATSLFLIVLLPNFLPKLNSKKIKIILWSTAIIYTFLVALSRIIAGAHFFMDTFIAVIVTLSSIFLTNHFLTNYNLKRQTTHSPRKDPAPTQENNTQE